MGKWIVWGALVAATAALGCTSGNNGGQTGGEGGSAGEGGMGGEGGMAGSAGAGGQGGSAGEGGQGGSAGVGGQGGSAGEGGMGGSAGQGGQGGSAGQGGSGGQGGIGGSAGQGGAGGVGGQGGSAGQGGQGGAGGMPDAVSCAAILSGDPGAASGIYTIDPDQSGPTAPVDTYCDMTTDGGGWTLLYDQDINVLSGYLPPSAWTSGVTNTAPNGGQFSILQLSSFFSQGGEWELRLDWDDRSTFVQWTQSQDPLAGRGVVTLSSQNPGNQIGCAGDAFAGLGPDGDGQSALDGDLSPLSCWWWAVGTSGPRQSGIPAYKNSDSGQLEAGRSRLWVR